MDLKQIKNIIKLVEDSGVNEVSIKEGEFSIKVVKKSAGEAASIITGMPASFAPPPVAAPTPTVAAAKPAPSESAAASSSEAPSSGFTQKSPIVGTFYAASSPDAKPYASVGDRVSKGQTLCIIEAMKIMNEIESETDGVVEKVLVSNGQAVEYDQPLFVIRN